MIKSALIVILAIFATQCSAEFVDALLEAQNAYRIVLNIAPLTWSADLAASAQKWADNLAETGRLVHSSTTNGENLAYITGTYTGDTSGATTDSSADATTDSSNTDNTDNSSTGDDSSNTGESSSTEPATSTEPEDNGQTTEAKKPKTHWSKTKTDHYGVVHKYNSDGGSSDNSGGRKLSSGGRYLSGSDEGDSDLVRLVGLWGAEKQYFEYGTFPDVSSTGDWSDVGHYTQIVWANTKQVGCGIANGNGNQYLVCQYYPAGNFDSETVY